MGEEQGSFDVGCGNQRVGLVAEKRAGVSREWGNIDWDTKSRMRHTNTVNKLFSGRSSLVMVPPRKVLVKLIHEVRVTTDNHRQST